MFVYIKNSSILPSQKPCLLELKTLDQIKLRGLRARHKLHVVFASIRSLTIDSQAASQ
jgi:hypothetical protein